MPKIIIQIAKLEAPSVDAAGRKFGAKAWDTAGTKYTVPKALFGMLQNGGWYEIFVEDKSYQGNPYKEIQSANATTPLTTGAAPVTVSARDDRGLKSWVCHLLGQAIAAGKIDALALSDIVEAGRIYRDAEKLIFTDDPVPQQHTNSGAPKQAAYATGPAPGGDDMSDEIPF